MPLGIDSDSAIEVGLNGPEDEEKDLAVIVAATVIVRAVVN